MSWLFPKKRTSELPPYWMEYLDGFERGLPKNVAENTFVVLDTETTGFDLEKDRILCLGALKLVKGNIVIKDSLEVYVEQEHYNAQSAEIHGIRKKGIQHRVPEAELVKILLTYVGNHVLVGHHIRFDIHMVNAALERNGLPKLMNKTLDTALLYKRTLLVSSVLQKKEKYSLDDLADKFGISKKDRHTALGDALITAIAFLRILDKLAPKSLRELFGKQNPPRIGF